MLVGVGSFFVARNLLRQAESALTLPTPTATASPSTDVTAPGTDTPTREPEGETFGMEIGDGVEVTEDGARWAVFITGVEWFDKPCEPYGVADHPIVVLDVTFEVYEGTASVNPLFDFTYITDDGVEAETNLFGFCDEPPLEDTYDRTAGDEVTGKIAFEVPDGRGGRLEYHSFFEPTASWIIPGQR